MNNNEVVKLMEGVDRLQHSNIDAGAAQIVSEPGSPMGDILAYVPQKNANGEYIVNDVDGLYEINFEEQVKVGNAMPKVVGGFGSYFEYKNIFLDLGLDFRFGGEVIDIAGHYMTGAGMFEETLEYRDAANGGISYYEDTDGNRVATSSAAGPNGERVWDDGVILPGVKSDGSENDVIVAAAEYYMDTYTWGANPAWGIPYSRYDLAVHENSYIKLREVAIGYNLPSNISQKFRCQNLRVSLIGMNLAYLYRTFDHFDPETNIGSSWVNQAIVQGSTSASRSFGFSVRASF
jgi:hypothetical protein